MRKAITLMLSVALLGIFAAVVVAAVSPSDGTTTLPTSSTGTTTTDATTTTGRTATTPDKAGVDISGPCDEAEHANDPRCTGVGEGHDERVDNSGPGNADDFYDDDHSGSGHGGGDDDDGFDDHGGGDFDDDTSGSGGGNSGHGGDD